MIAGKMEVGGGGGCRRGPLPELSVQLGFHFLNLLKFERADDPPPPGLTGASQGDEHPFQHGPLAEGVGDGFGPAAFFAKQPFQEVGGPKDPAVGDR